jgi:two-component system, chemotaxis family, chemotaxis protein CheY
MRILIADDQKDVGRSLADLVRFCNHQVVGIVASGLDAIQAYARYHPDLVLMDHRMPKLNGATACRNILSKDPAARVILVSAWSPSDDASASGAIAMLPKPVSLEQLDAALNRVAETLPALSPAEMPFPEFCFQPDPVDYPVNDFQSFVPTPFSDLPAPNFDFPGPISDLPTPIFEITLPVDAPPNSLQQTEETCALDKEKISGKRRSGRRRARRSPIFQLPVSAFAFRISKLLRFLLSMSNFACALRFHLPL